MLVFSLFTSMHSLLKPSFQDCKLSTKIRRRGGQRKSSLEFHGWHDGRNR